MCGMDNTAPYGCAAMDRTAGGEEGWFGREGQLPGPSMIVTHLTQVGECELLGVIIQLGDNRRMAPIDLDGPRMPRVSQPHSC